MDSQKSLYTSASFSGKSEKSKVSKSTKKGGSPKRTPPTESHAQSSLNVEVSSPRPELEPVVFGNFSPQEREQYNLGSTSPKRTENPTTAEEKVVSAETPVAALSVSAESTMPSPSASEIAKKKAELAKKRAEDMKKQAEKLAQQFREAEEARLIAEEEAAEQERLELLEEERRKAERLEQERLAEIARKQKEEEDRLAAIAKKQEEERLAEIARKEKARLAELARKKKEEEVLAAKKAAEEVLAAKKAAEEARAAKKAAVEKKTDEKAPKAKSAVPAKKSSTGPHSPRSKAAAHAEAKGESAPTKKQGLNPAVEEFVKSGLTKAAEAARQEHGSKRHETRSKAIVIRETGAGHPIPVRSVPPPPTDMSRKQFIAEGKKHVEGSGSKLAGTPTKKFIPSSTRSGKRLREGVDPATGEYTWISDSEPSPPVKKAKAQSGKEVSTSNRPSLTPSAPPAAQKVLQFPAGKITGIMRYGVWFLNDCLAKQWDIKIKRTIVEEKLLVIKTFPAQSVINLVTKANMMKTLIEVEKYSPQIVREIIANITPEFGDPKSSGYGESYCRGYRIMITPDIINEFFGRTGDQDPSLEQTNLDTIVSALYGSKTTNCQNKKIEFKFMTTLYSMLHVFAKSNWIPSTVEAHLTRSEAYILYAIKNDLSFDLGSLVFKQIAKHWKEDSVNISIGFPSLIYRLALDQVPHLSRPSDVQSAPPKKFYINYNLYGGQHYFDLPHEEGHLQRTHFPNLHQGLPKDPEAPTPIVHPPPSSTPAEPSHPAGPSGASSDPSINLMIPGMHKEELLEYLALEAKKHLHNIRLSKIQYKHTIHMINVINGVKDDWDDVELVDFGAGTQTTDASDNAID